MVNEIMTRMPIRPDRKVHVIDGSNIFYWDDGDWMWRKRQTKADFDRKPWQLSAEKPWYEDLHNLNPDVQLDLRKLQSEGLNKEITVPWQLVPRTLHSSGNEYKHPMQQKGDVIVVSSMEAYTKSINQYKEQVSTILTRFLADDGKLFFVIVGPDYCKFAKEPCMERVGNDKCIFKFADPTIVPYARHDLCEYDDLLALQICDALVGEYQKLGSTNRPELITADKNLRIFWLTLGHFIGPGSYAARVGRVVYRVYKEALDIFEQVATAGRMRFGIAEYTLEEYKRGEGGDFAKNKAIRGRRGLTLLWEP